jgi:hypothetical protein
MNLQREKVVVIRRYNYDEPAGIRDLPKRDIYLEVSQLSEFDNRAVPEQRKSPERSRWTTQLAILELFLLSTNNWLLLLEDDVNLQSEHLEKIQNAAKPGLTLFSDDASAFLLDKGTAATIVAENRLFYAPLNEVFTDLQKLGKLQIQKPFTLPKLSPNHLYTYLPLILTVTASLLILFGPTYRPFTKQFIGLAEVLGTEEPSMSR